MRLNGKIYTEVRISLGLLNTWSWRSGLSWRCTSHFGWLSRKQHLSAILLAEKYVSPWLLFSYAHRFDSYAVIVITCVGQKKRWAATIEQPEDRDSYLSYTKNCQVMGLSVHASVANWICH